MLVDRLKDRLDGYAMVRNVSLAGVAFALLAFGLCATSQALAQSAPSGKAAWQNLSQQFDQGGKKTRKGVPDAVKSGAAPLNAADIINQALQNGLQGAPEGIEGLEGTGALDGAGAANGVAITGGSPVGGGSPFSGQPNLIGPAFGPLLSQGFILSGQPFDDAFSGPNAAYSPSYEEFKGGFIEPKTREFQFY
ncbi:MAG: hypothetical protein AAF530_09975 [Pseudomonadota bacterium]